MLLQIRHYLKSVLLRQRMERCYRWMIDGTIVGALVGVGLAVMRLLGMELPASAPPLVVVASALAAAIAGWLVPVSWNSAARLVDTYYRMKDSTVTALDFASRQSQEPLHLLQMEEAVRCLERINPQVVVPLRAPKRTPGALVSCGAFAGLMLLPNLLLSEPVGPTEPLQVVREQAQSLETSMLEDVRELAAKHETPELEELAKELEQLVEELKAPEVDQREALAKLSEMQQAVSAALEQFSLEQVDAQLKELAAAMEPSQSLQAIAEALKQGEYDKAAMELEKIDTSTMNRKERDAVSENLKKYSKNLGAGKEGQLSEAAQEMAEGLENENESQCKAGACKAAGVCKSQGLKKSISQCLNCQLNRLAQCKGACQGQCNSEGPARKSDEPSNKAGKAASGQPLGEDKTRLDSTRREEHLTGLQGDGPSERETSNSPEGEQQAVRSYQEKYTEFRRQMEEVLDSEPLPLGHRETVRKYFESIRPSNAEAAAVDQ